MLRRPIIHRFAYTSPRKKKAYLGFSLIALLVVVGLFSMLSLGGADEPAATPVFNDGANEADSINTLNRWSKIAPRDIINKILPIEGFQKGTVQPESFSLVETVDAWFKFITRAELGTARGILNSQLIALAEAANFEQQAQLLPPAPPPEEIPVTAEPKRSFGDKVLVGIYNSHNAETYALTDGVDRLPGKNGGVSKVAQVLAETLTEQYGIGAVYDDTIHDYPRWGDSYGNSETTAKKLLKKYPDIQILIDVHRDAGVNRRETVTIQGEKAANILLIVGTDTRWQHPNWQQNLRFAKEVNRTMKEMYPGLSSGVRTQSGRYNQHLHPQAILAEMGSASNSLDDVKHSARLFAGVLARVLQQTE